MAFDGLLSLHFAAVLASAVVLTVSLTLYILLAEPWRLRLTLFIGCATVFLLCDTAWIAFADGPSWLPPALAALMCGSGALVVAFAVKLYRFGMRFVLMRWERRFLFLILIPVAYLSVAAFLFFFAGTASMAIIVVTYVSAMGVALYLLSLKRARGDADGAQPSGTYASREKPADARPDSGERELVFFLMTAAVLLPLELLEYAYKMFRGGSPFFPMRLLVTPLFLIETGSFFAITGFRTVARLRTYRSRAGVPVSAPSVLTEREKEVSLLIVEGLTHGEIAVKLFISRRTVDRHVENIYRKCGAKNKADFIRSVLIPNS